MITDKTRSALFDPINLGDLELPNRIVMAPCTRCRADENSVPQEINAIYYGQRASAGLIITEASQISQQGSGYPGTPGIYTSEQIAGWQKVTARVHENDGRIFLQLWHVGRISHPCFQPGGKLPVAPSPVKPAGEAMTQDGMKPFETPHALDREEIKLVLDDFYRAAKNARLAGFDGVEIHAANGYLIDQFLRDRTNLRTDDYGGSIENRTRFLLEVTGTVTSVWEPNRVGVRLSPAAIFNDMNDSDPVALFTSAAKALNRFDLAYLHIIELTETVDYFPFEKIRAVFNGPYMANAGYDFNTANDAVTKNRADLISFGQMFIANPDLPARFSRGAPLNKADPATLYSGDEEGYIDYPALEV